MRDLRLGDPIDDYCVKCRRLTNHQIVSIVNGSAAKVRCGSCYSDHYYLREQVPPSKKELQKQKLVEAASAEASLTEAPAEIEEPMPSVVPESKARRKKKP